MQHNLGHNFETQGIVKPGANMEEIVALPTTVTSKLTKKDAIVIWGGIQDIGRNKLKTKPILL
jgi:hypothetical protein